MNMMVTYVLLMNSTNVPNKATLKHLSRQESSLNTELSEMDTGLETSSIVNSWRWPVYPSYSHTVVFVLDQSSCHTKYFPLALNAKNILKEDGGPKRVRWAGNPQLMVNPNGTAKGYFDRKRDKRRLNTSSKISTYCC